ncbi:MAG TPA: DUF177 domain-containing protein [Actinobacteria bacterium]|nr:DUF177 domain-containing protein [Actinomycetota bacterium]
MNELKVDISDIRGEASAHKSFEVKSDLGSLDIRGQTINLGEVSSSGEVTNADEGIMAQATANGHFDLQCSRCLANFGYDLNIDISEFFSFEDGEAEYVVEDDNIDLAGPVIEAIALNLDIKTLCKNSCKGLCDKCGTNLNLGKCECKTEKIDIRLKKLQDLKSSLESKDREK